MYLTIYLHNNNKKNIWRLVLPALTTVVKNSLLYVGPSLYYVSKGTGWVGSENWQFLLMLSTIYANVEWVDGSERVQKYADVI